MAADAEGRIEDLLRDDPGLPAYHREALSDLHILARAFSAVISGRGAY